MKSRVVVAVLVLAAGGAAGMALARWQETSSGIASAFTLRSQAAPDSFAVPAEIAMRSVVHITTRTVTDHGLLWGPTEREGIGSGIVVSPEGDILTNYHVVRDAQHVRVFFVNGRQFEARVKGVDVETDLALIRVSVPAGFDLTPIVFGDSDRARIGDWVLAIGSPFGFNHTLTAGIISARHRRAGLDLRYQDFLQTDAAINPGNSGGALVNLKGELVGINAAIASTARSSDGVGFAIPSNLARWVYEQLQKEGRVRRGALGLYPTDLNDELVRQYESSDIHSLEDLLKDLKLKEPVGAFVYQVVEGTPADEAGLRRGDVIVEFDGKTIRNAQELFFRVAEAGPERKVVIRFLRDGVEKSVTVELAEKK